MLVCGSMTDTSFKALHSADYSANISQWISLIRVRVRPFTPASMSALCSAHRTRLTSIIQGPFLLLPLNKHRERSALCQNPSFAHGFHHLHTRHPSSLTVEPHDECHDSLNASGQIYSLCRITAHVVCVEVACLPFFLGQPHSREGQCLWLGWLYRIKTMADFTSFLGAVEFRIL